MNVHEAGVGMTIDPSPRILVLACAAEWWKSKRPGGWTEDEHIAEPTVNTSSPWEQELACAVANWTRDGRARDKAAGLT